VIAERGRRFGRADPGSNGSISASLTLIYASNLPPEKRSLLLERIAARLSLHGHRFTDADLDRAIRLALSGLIQNSAA
jgi:hypothetical protein